MKTKITLSILLSLISIAAYSYFIPERILVSCPGSQTMGYMNPYTENGKIFYDLPNSQEQKQKIKKYFFGLLYTLNEFELNECELSDNTVFCYKEDIPNREKNEEYFDLERNIFNSHFKSIWVNKKNNQTNLTEVSFRSKNCQKITAEKY